MILGLNSLSVWFCCFTTERVRKKPGRSIPSTATTHRDTCKSYLKKGGNLRLESPDLKTNRRVTFPRETLPLVSTSDSQCGRGNNDPTTFPVDTGTIHSTTSIPFFPTTIPWSIQAIPEARLDNLPHDLPLFKHLSVSQRPLTTAQPSA